jgi:redox-sensitive bicupin YhaK (pirin superfamily)
MIQVQPFARLGHFQNEWLNARHHFSFASYHDPARMGVGDLRVWNDDEIAPGTGFDPHPHRDMEIITYVREGAISHRDGLGNAGRTEAGDVQVMHAGTGIVHSERNEGAVPTRLFQIWILPSRRGAAPGWATRKFPRSGGGLVALADGRPGAERQGADGSALPLNADAAVLAATLSAGQTVRHRLGAGRVGYLVPSVGTITVNGVAAGTRDGVMVTGEDEISITATADAEIVLVDTVE